SLLRLVVVESIKQGVGVRVGGEDVELTDRHVLWRLLLGHAASPPIALPFVAVEPAGGGRPDVPGRMDGAGRDQKLFPDLRVAEPADDLEVHLTLQDDDQLVSRMREVLPAPSGRVGPEVATEPPLRPCGGNLLTVDDPHSQSPSSGPRPAGPRNCPEGLGRET